MGTQTKIPNFVNSEETAQLYKDKIVKADLRNSGKFGSGLSPRGKQKKIEGARTLL